MDGSYRSGRPTEPGWWKPVFPPENPGRRRGSTSPASVPMQVGPSPIMSPAPCPSLLPCILVVGTNPEPDLRVLPLRRGEYGWEKVPGMVYIVTGMGLEPRESQVAPH